MTGVAFSGCDWLKQFGSHSDQKECRGSRSSPTSSSLVNLPSNLRWNIVPSSKETQSPHSVPRSSPTDTTSNTFLQRTLCTQSTSLAETLCPYRRPKEDGGSWKELVSGGSGPSANAAKIWQSATSNLPIQLRAAEPREEERELWLADKEY